MTKLDLILKQHPNIWKTEAAFLSWLRGGIRRIWSKHPVKLEFIKQNRIKVPNPNPRGKVKEVWGGVCALTGEAHILSNLDCDHKQGNHSLKSLDDIDSFVKGILLITLDDLQFVSKEAHKIKSYAEKQGVSLEQAKAEKQSIELIKQKKDKLYLQQCGISVPSNAAARRKAIVEHLLTVDVVN